MFLLDYEKVGYIVIELIWYLYLLFNDLLFEVLVKNICFCIIFFMIGFYVIINIIKRG